MMEGSVWSGVVAISNVGSELKLDVSGSVMLRLLPLSRALAPPESLPASKVSNLSISAPPTYLHYAKPGLGARLST